MKKKVLFFTLPLMLFASEMPPMPPGFFETKKETTTEIPKEKEKKDVKVRKSPFPEECDVLPPMLFSLPPPMQADMDKCTAALYRPSNENLMKALYVLEGGVDVEIISVEEAEGFKQIYEVKYKLAKKTSTNTQFKVINQKEENYKVIYSNPKATKFFTTKAIEIK